MEYPHPHPDPAAGQSLKRKLETENATYSKVHRLDFHLRQILRQISLLNSASDRVVVKNAILVLVKHLKQEDLIDTIVRCGAVPILVRHLQSVKVKDDDDVDTQYEIEKGCALVLGFLATKLEHQQLIMDAGALPCLIDLLRRHKISTISRLLIGLLRRVADAIYYLARENTIIKTLVRIEGGIPPLVELLELNVTKVQRAAAYALRTLSVENDDSKKQIVECNALPTLVLMLQSEDPTIHCSAVGVIGNLVDSSPDIQRDVLLAGALQPAICLLSSCCCTCQSEAAFVLSTFAVLDSDCKVHISQRGAVPPLIDMLKSSDVQRQGMSACVLWRLAKDPHNQVGIAHNGGIEALLNLLDSDHALVQRHAACALYHLADNEDLVVDIIKAGGFQKLKDGHFRDQRAYYYVAETLKRLEKMQGQALKHIIYFMRFAEKGVQRCVAIALAYLCSPHDCKTIFIDNNGLELLLDILESPNVKQKGDASAALHKLAAKASSFVSIFDTAYPSTPQKYLGEEYINNPKLSDVTFLVEGRSFYAHRACLLSSGKFQGIFDDDYREREAEHVIPNIKWNVFELMMRFIYTGTVDVNSDIAQDLLRAADQYLLDGLKRICENVIAQDISVENVSLVYKMSKDFNATTLKHACIMFILQNF